MTDKRMLDFPVWLIRKLVNNLRNRKYKDIYNNRKELTWYECSRYAINKVMRIHRYKTVLFFDPTGRQEDWSCAINYQFRKYNKMFCLHDLWFRTEYRCLTIMNTKRFKKQLAPDVIWEYVVQNQTRLISIVKSRKNSPNLDNYRPWHMIIGGARIRLSNQYKHIFLDWDLWHINIQFNLRKWKHFESLKEWDTIIGRQYKKCRKIWRTAYMPRISELNEVP